MTTHGGRGGASGSLAPRRLHGTYIVTACGARCFDKAGVRHIRGHDAPHTYASLMLRREVPLGYVSRQLGHSSIQVTVDPCGHFVPGADRHHIEGLADAIEGATAGPNAT